MQFLSDALNSASILLREGLEAMLIIAALAAFLVKANAADRVRWLYAGALAAVLASLVGAYVFAHYFNGAHDDRFEALVMAVAAAVMLYMSGWLFLRQNPAAWRAGLERAAERAIGAGTALSFASLAFLAVFREGAETVLFLHAAARTAGGWSAGLVGGLATATVLLIGLFVAMERLALKLPLRALFVATSAFLFVMALRFIGFAIQELQEQAMVPVHHAPMAGWLTQIGLNATWEALGAQMLIGLVAVLSTLGAMRLRSSGVPSPASS